MSDKRPAPPEYVWEWYSMCSRHPEYEESCGSCNAGRWVNELEREFNNWLWTYSPSIWKKWANRDNISGWRQWLRKHVWGKQEK